MRHVIPHLRHKQQLEAVWVRSIYDLLLVLLFFDSVATAKQVPPQRTRPQTNSLGVSVQADISASLVRKQQTVQEANTISLPAPGNSVKALMGGSDSQTASARLSTVPNDLWAIHDLLLVGYGAVFMKPGTGGANDAQNAALGLAELLPKVHPHGPCRTQIADSLKRAGTGKSRVGAVARSSWECLPGKFSKASFENEDAYEESSIGNFDSARDARMPMMSKPSELGTCRHSLWPRACSIWASLHTMAIRADSKGLGKELFNAISPILASGATMCGGCTLHLRALHEGVLTPGIDKDFGDVF